MKKKKTEKPVPETAPAAKTSGLSAKVQAATAAQEFCYLTAVDLVPNSRNPRSEIDGPGFGDLIDSIAAKGILEPLIVRPLGTPTAGGARFEVVAGGRRFAAAVRLGMTQIPVLVRNLTDDEAYDVLLIENLQRQDLTDYDEAVSFRAFLSRHGKKADDLSARTGIPTPYIRRHVAVLDLPLALQEDWKKGRATFSHLEQFLRITKNQDEFKKTYADFRRDLDEWSVNRLRSHINNLALDLGISKFDLTACRTCGHNGIVQKSLFDIGEGKARCLDRTCYLEKQGKWFKEHWMETREAKKYKTRGFRFHDSVNWNDFEAIYTDPPTKCLECDSFVSLIDLKGKIERYAQACIGDKACYKQSRRAERAKEEGGGKKKSAGDGPRVSWHGEFFRQQFYRRRIAEVLAGKPVDHMLPRLAIITLARRSHPAKEAVAKELGLTSRSLYIEDEKVVEAVLKLGDKDWGKISATLGAAVVAVMVEGEFKNGYDTGDFPTGCRRLVAEHLGIDIGKEWAVTEEYLQRKTIREILAFVKKSGIEAELQKLYPTLWGTPSKLKKAGLIDGILHSGLQLIGRVPEEVIGKKR